MIRRLVVPVTAMVLALVTGLVLGASVSSGRLVRAVAADRDAATGQVTALHGQVSDADARLEATERFVAESAPTAVRGTLSGTAVAVVVAPDADPGDVASVTELAGRAGARVTGRLQLTDAMLAPERADSVRALVPRLLPSAAALPSSSDAATLAGSLVAAVATRSARPVAASEAVTALSGLADAGLVAPTPAVAPAPAQLVLVVAGASGDPARGTALARFAGALDRSAGTVLAGREPSAAVSAARSDPALRGALSTVAGLPRPSGRLATVLGLADQAAGRGGPVGPATTTGPASATGPSTGAPTSP